MRHQNYGWASQYPLSTLTVSGTAERKGLSNQPDTAQQEANLSLLSDFLGRIPFPFTLTSAYRSYAVNTAVGGAIAALWSIAAVGVAVTTLGVVWALRKRGVI